MGGDMEPEWLLSAMAACKPIADWMSASPLGDLLRLCQPSPLPDDYWHVPGELKVLETIIWTLTIIAALLVARAYRPRVVPVRKPRCGDTYRTAPWWQTLWGYGHLLCLCSQVVYKYRRGYREMNYLLMPCHMLALTYAYVMLSRNYRRCYDALNVLIYFWFFPFLAIAMPDTSEMTGPGELAMFELHHWMIALAPLVLILSDRFPLDRTDHYYFFVAYAVGGAVITYVHQSGALLSGINVNYMMRPALHSDTLAKIGGDAIWYRTLYSAGLPAMGYTSGRAWSWAAEQLGVLLRALTGAGRGGKAKAKAKRS